MQASTELIYDVATALGRGKRERQEDSVASDFCTGTSHGFAVLADGMGGHASGDIASKIAVTEVFAGLKLWSDAPRTMESRIAEILHDTAQHANSSIENYTQARPEATGMGATLLATVIVEDRLYWLSIGDSPLFLFRADHLYRLNDEHSYARQLDQFVADGRLQRSKAIAHPDRHCVTSVLTGQTIPQIDCRSVPLRLRDNDVLVIASDGLLSLPQPQLEQLLRQTRHLSCANVCQRILRSVAAENFPEQDNVAFCIISLRHPETKTDSAPIAPSQTPQMRKRQTLLATGNPQRGLNIHFDQTELRSCP